MATTKTKKNTKEVVIDEKKTKEVEYALAEYQGIIIGVFKVDKWYAVKTQDNKNNKRWGFDGEEANEELKKVYLNKSIAHIKKPGAANPIRYKL